MTGKQHDYRAYLMRLWRDSPSEPWRGSLEDPHTGERRHFASVAQLVDSIIEQADKQGDHHVQKRSD